MYLTFVPCLFSFKHQLNPSKCYFQVSEWPGARAGRAADAKYRVDDLEVGLNIPGRRVEQSPGQLLPLRTSARLRHRADPGTSPRHGRTTRAAEPAQVQLYNSRWVSLNIYTHNVLNMKKVPSFILNCLQSEVLSDLTPSSLVQAIHNSLEDFSTGCFRTLYRYL